MLTFFSKRISLGPPVFAALFFMAAAASAETLMMPKRDALKGTPVVVWGVSTLTPATNCTINFGDSPTNQSCLTGYDRSYIATTHTYTTAGNYTATLTVTNGATTESATVALQVWDPADPV